MALQVGELAAVRSPEGSGRVIAAARDGEHPVLEEVQTCVWLLSPLLVDSPDLEGNVVPVGIALQFG